MPRAKIICRQCGVEGRAQGLGLCSHCYMAQYTPRPRPCTTCGEVRIVHAQGLCRKCNARRVRHADGSVACAKCNRIRPIHAKGLCSSCYQMRRPVRVGAARLRACAGCGNTRRIVAWNLCSSCYRAQHQLAEKVCSECSEVKPSRAHGLCFRCEYRRLLGKSVLCAWCRETRIHAGYGACAKCLSSRGVPNVECQKCGKLGEAARSGAFSTCSCRKRKRRGMILCPTCNQVRRAGALGRCEACYRKFKTRLLADCSACGRIVEYRRRGMCLECFHRSPLALQVLKDRLVDCQGWASRLLGRFARYLTARGYEPQSAERAMRAFTVELAANADASQSEFCGALGRRLEAHLQTRGRLRAIDLRFAEFLRDKNLARGMQLSADGNVGRTIFLANSAPEAIRADIRFWCEILFDEVAYRKRTGEPSTSPLKIFHRVRTVAQWGQWLDERGLTWQQLTPERFRSRLETLRRYRSPGVVKAHLHELNAFMDTLKAHRKLFSNPLRRMRYPRTPGLIDRPFRDGDLTRCLRRLNSPDECPTTRVIGLLAVLHGLRPTEIAALKKAEVDMSRRTLRLVGRGLCLELDPVTLDALSAYVATRPSGRNRHLIVTSKTRLSLRAASSGFVGSHLAELGIRARQARQRFIQQMVISESSLVVSRLFRLSPTSVSKHMSHQTILFREQLQEVTDFVQDNY